MDLKELFAWITGVDGGAFLIVSWAFAWAMEDVKAWQGLSSRLRSLTVLGVSLVLGLLTVWLGSQPDIVKAIEPYMQPVINIVLVWIATQAAHKLDPKRVENNGEG